MPRAPCVRHDTSVADQGEAALALSRAPAVRQSWLWNDDKGLVLAEKWKNNGDMELCVSYTEE